MKVSFDFDDCLDMDEVQEYCSELIARGVDVWICTARTPSLGEIDNKDTGWNRDVFIMCDKLGIPDDHVLMTDCGLKSDHLRDKGFVWHLDDMLHNYNDLTTNSDVTPVYYHPSVNWREECENLLKEYV